MLKRWMTICLMTAGSVAAFAQKSDSLLLALNEKKGAERIEVLHELVLSNWLNYPTLAMQYADEAYEISVQSKDSSNISKSLRLIAGVHYYKGEYDTSLVYNQRALIIANKLQDKALINNCYNNLGLLYYNLGSYPQALEYLMSSISIKDQIGEIYGKATTLNNIGLIYEKNKQYDKARLYFTQALELARATENNDLIVYSLNNTGLTWLRQNQLETAKVYFENGRNLAEEINNIFWGSVSLRGLGEIYLLKNQYKQAIKLYEKSLDESRSIEDKKGISEAYALLSYAYMQQRDYIKALQMLDSSQYYALLINSAHLIEDNLRLYISINRLIGNQQKIIQYQNEYIQFQDSLFNDAMNRNLNLVPVKLAEESERLKMIEQLGDLEQRTFVNKVFVVILLFSIPVIAVLILLLSKIRSSNLKLRKKNEEIEQQSSEIEAQNLKLNHSIKQLRRTQSLLSESEKMATIGQLVGGLAHELNNPLNFIGGIIRPMHMNFKDLETLAPEIKNAESYKEIQMLLKGVEEGTDRASNLIEKLKAISPKLRTQEKETFNFADCIEETIELLEKEYDKINFINNLVAGPIMVTSNYYEITKILYAVINNAVQAVLKNIPTNRKVYLETRQTFEQLEIIVQDNGPGIDPKDLNKIFTPFYTTKKEAGASGLGLFVAHTLIDRNAGSIRAESILGQGTTVTIILPINGNN